MHEIGGNYDHCLTIVKGNQGHPGRAARIRARRDREDLRPRVRFRGFAQVRVRNPLEITPIRKRETELNPRRGSARLRANRFAPLQTVDRPKPGKLRDQDGWQAGCARKRVLPSRFLIGLSRASDETGRKDPLKPSTPQLLRGRLASRGRLARRSPRRRPSELAPLGPSFLRRQGRDLLSCRRFVLLSTGRGWGKSSPGTRPSPTRQVAPLTDCLRGAQGLFLTRSSRSPRRGGIKSLSHPARLNIRKGNASMILITQQSAALLSRSGVAAPCQTERKTERTESNEIHTRFAHPGIYPSSALA